MQERIQEKKQGKIVNKFLRNVKMLLINENNKRKCG
jgi:hypothetical protein